MKNKLSDLTNHLFAQLERLGDEDLSVEDIEKETSRSEAIVSVADRITKNADIQLKAAALYGQHREDILPHLPKIGNSGS